MLIKYGFRISHFALFKYSLKYKSMFEITDKSFTFTYAEEELKEKTNYIVETVAECINKYILK